MTNLLLAPVLIPIITGLLCICLKLKHASLKKLVLICLFISFFFTIPIIVYSNQLACTFKLNNFVNFSLTNDVLGVVVYVLACLLWTFVAIYSFGYFSNNDNQNRFFGIFIIAFAMVTVMAFAKNIFTYFIAYEVFGICTLLMMMYSGSQESFYSAHKYSRYSIYSSVLIIAGMIFLYSKTGTLEFFPGGPVSELLLSSEDFIISYMLLFTGFGIRAAIVPLHGWLCDSMSAPTPVCALIIEVMAVKTSILALINITFYLFTWNVIESMGINTIMIIFVILNILMGSFLAIHQTSLKKLLAYSTISQLGYIMLCLVVYNPKVFTGAFLHFVIHSLNKLIMFLCVGFIIHQTGVTKISDINGIGKKMPVTMTCFTISSLSLIGIPPLNGFISKWYLAIGCIELGRYIVPIFLLLSALLAGGYLLPVIRNAFFREPDNFKLDNYENNTYMLYPIVGLSIINVLIGIFPQLLIQFIESAAYMIFS